MLEEMLTLYYPPFRADDDVELMDQSVVALRAYVEDLIEFDEGALKAGWRDARRAHKVERWPTIQTIRDSCISRQSDGHRNASALPGNQSTWTERVERWLRTGGPDGGLWPESFGPAPHKSDTDCPWPLVERYRIVEMDSDREAKKHAKWRQDHPEWEAVRKALDSGVMASALIDGVPKSVPVYDGEKRRASR